MKKHADTCSNCGSTNSNKFWDYPNGLTLCDKCEHSPKPIKYVYKLKKHQTLLLIVILLLIGITFFYFMSNFSNQKISYLENENLTLQNKINSLQSDLSNLNENYSQVSSELNNLKNEYTGAQKIPYIVMSGRTVTAVFKKIDGTIISWQWPADSFEGQLKQGYTKRELIPNTVYPIVASFCNIGVCTNQMQQIMDLSLKYKNLNLNNNSTIKVIDVTEFIDSTTFADVINTVYDSSKTDQENIEEIYNLNKQLTTYATEIQDTPRYPLETLSEGGGDCEDKAILVASLLKAVPKNWKVQIVYMDSENPSNPKKVDHVLVYVNTGTYQTFIETTAETNGLNYWNKEINGWYFDV